MAEQSIKLHSLAAASRYCEAAHGVRVAARTLRAYIQVGLLTAWPPPYDVYPGQTAKFVSEGELDQLCLQRKGRRRA
jgi:hypothetical protein